MRDSFIEGCLAEEKALTGDFDTGVPCRIPGCPGTIVETVSAPPPQHAVSDLVYRIRDRQSDAGHTFGKYYCSICAVSYHHLPEPAKQRVPLKTKKK